MDEIKIEIIQDDENKNTTSSKMTSPYMTKFEYAKLLGVRTTQLSKGATPQVERNGRMNPQEIAREEINKRVVPLVIKRTLPNGKIEIWKITELNIRSW